MNTIALVGISEKPMIEKKLYQKRVIAWLVSASLSVRGKGLNECLITVSLSKFLRSALAVQLVSIGTMWLYVEFTLTRNE